MFSDETRTALAGLTTAVLSLRPLIDRLDQPVPVAAADGQALSDGHGHLQRVLDRVASRLGAPSFRLIHNGQLHELGTFGATVSRRLDLAASAEALRAVPAEEMPAVDRVVDQAVAEDFDGFCTREVARGPDCVPVNAYAAGDPRSPAVVIAAACGMPARLAEAWIRRLSANYYVLVWESRGLFWEAGGCDDFDGATDVAAQAGDLFVVLDHFGVATAHVAGLCGGAVIALAAAADRPERISSLSLWHGDYELGDDQLKTDHQRNLQALMAMATQARVSASGIHAVLSQSIAQSTPPDLAHLVLYPYATPGLLFRYCLLNGAIMETDLRAWFASISQPTLVVTSQDDQTAHPAGSRFVAAALPNARLHVTPHGDHISLFRGPPDLLSVAARFLADPTP